MKGDSKIDGPIREERKGVATRAESAVEDWAG